MDKRLIKIAAKAVSQVYKSNISIKSTQFDLVNTMYNGSPIQIIPFAGSNDKVDWLWNIWLWSSDGAKRSAVVAARRVFNSEEYKEWRKPEMPLLVCGHSKSGPTSLRWKSKYGADYCVSFCPAPGFRRPVPTLKNTLIVTDPDDIVPYLGGLSFGQPDCERKKLKRDKKWWNLKDRLSDHPMSHILEWANGL